MLSCDFCQLFCVMTAVMTTCSHQAIESVTSNICTVLLVMMYRCPRSWRTCLTCRCSENEISVLCINYSLVRFCARSWATIPSTWKIWWHLVSVAHGRHMCVFTVYNGSLITLHWPPACFSSASHPIVTKWYLSIVSIVSLFNAASRQRADGPQLPVTRHEQTAKVPLTT